MVETVSQGEAGRAIADEVRDAYMAGGAGRIMKQLVFARTRIQTLEAEVRRLREVVEKVESALTGASWSERPDLRTLLLEQTRSALSTSVGE